MSMVTERQVVIICGPPCAGKTTYANQHAEPGDTIIDADTIAHELGSTEQWDHDPDIAMRAQLEWSRRVATITPDTMIRAWIIRCAPTIRQRRILTRTTGATRTEILIPDQATLMARARQRPNPEGTAAAIARWLATYQSNGVTQERTSRTW